MMDEIILVNKEHPISKNYVPNDLIITDQNKGNFHKYVDSSLKPMVSSKIYPYFKKMQEDALKQNLHIIIDSGYRSYEYQEKVYNNLVDAIGVLKADKKVAKPGCSEHQTGLAIDVAYIRNNKYTDNVLEDDLETKWMMENAHKYGFILRYPKDKEKITGYVYEPWHYRYVGVIAKKLYEQNITLEEYYMKYM